MNNLKEHYKTGTFNEYGFETPNFKGEILKQIGEVYFGYVVEDIENISKKYNGVTWRLDGKLKFCNYSFRGFNGYDLTPIKKEWWQDEDALPIIVYDNVLNKFEIVDKIGIKGSIELQHKDLTTKHERFRPATKEEVETLYYKG